MATNIMTDNDNAENGSRTACKKRARARLAEMKNPSPPEDGKNPDYRVDSPEPTIASGKRPKLGVEIAELPDETPTSPESYRERKARTRAALAEHFLEQPRGLDVIQEEGCGSGITWSAAEPAEAEVVYVEDSSESDAEEGGTVPESLRTLCIRSLLALPFGGDVLRELAEVSEAITRLHEGDSQSDLADLIRENWGDFSGRLEVTRRALRIEEPPRRSLREQLEEIREKERRLQREIDELEEERRGLLDAELRSPVSSYRIPKRRDFAVKSDGMYEEYMGKIGELRERKSRKILKITSPGVAPKTVRTPDIREEFMSRVHERMIKFGIDLNDLELPKSGNLPQEDLPEHLREFVELTETDREGVWSPGQNRQPQTKPDDREAQTNGGHQTPVPAVWTPRSAGSSPIAGRKEFRPVNFGSPERSDKIRPEPRPAPGIAEIPVLPKTQNPTVTLLQRARGQLPKGGASNIHRADTSLLGNREESSRNSESRHEPMPEHRIYPGRMDDSDGIPTGLRSEVKEANQSKWYKKMYETIHKQKPDREYVTVRYKQRRARPYVSGYFSEPEHTPGNFSAFYYDSDSAAPPPDRNFDSTPYMSSTLPARSRETLRDDPKRPGRIENYLPGRSSISDKEAKEWWDEVMDIFDGHLEGEKPSQQQQRHRQPKSFINQALKESGYESDSTLVFKRREEAQQQQLSPIEQKEAYKSVQKGGDVPLHGLRKPAPERPKGSPRKYVENEVTIHYKAPVRLEVKEAIGEEELRRRQAEHMRRAYEDERRRKHLQELRDAHSRRHADHFAPSEKSPIALNRYDDFPAEDPPPPRSPEPRLVARALYDFAGQSARELTFRRGDAIRVRRQVDRNWYEGEHNAAVGLCPANYVQIVARPDSAGPGSSPRKPHEGQARAKFNFVAQTRPELSLARGELVALARRVDDNWFEGRIGARRGIFPASYVEVLIDPSAARNGVGVASQPAETSRVKNPMHQALHIDTRSEPIPYRALYKYSPQNEDELELLEGDAVHVLEKCDDGWYVGSSLRTGAFGTFPGNYVARL